MQEVLDHHLGFHSQIHIVKCQRPGQGARRLFPLHMGIIVTHLDKAKIRLVGNVVPQHVQDELFLNGLPHRVEVERSLPGGAGLVKDLQRFVFRRGGEGEET